jgi:hypothetical protein
MSTAGRSALVGICQHTAAGLLLLILVEMWEGSSKVRSHVAQQVGRCLVGVYRNKPITFAKGLFWRRSLLYLILPKMRLPQESKVVPLNSQFNVGSGYLGLSYKTILSHLCLPRPRLLPCGLNLLNLRFKPCELTGATQASTENRGFSMSIVQQAHTPTSSSLVISNRNSAIC